MSGGEDWEEKLIEQLSEMFRNMGMPMDKDQLRKLMEQFRSQFEGMGIDAEKIAKGEVNFNFDLSNLAKMFAKGDDLSDIIKNMGMAVEVDAAVEIPTPTSEKKNDAVIDLPSDDIYLDGWNMSVTIDFSLRGEIEQDQVELSLVDGGQQIEVLKNNQTQPLATIALPHQCEDVVEFSLNNGILDITLKLTPQGSATESTANNVDLDDEDYDDDTPLSDNVGIDFADDDDDDDDDDEDGGIKIF
jgi:HSP20 family molecular chaperone IbpA